MPPRSSATTAAAQSEHEPNEVLSCRALNRALLARQMLLHRATLPAAEAIEQLVGLQAQAPHAPYVGLWARLEGVVPDDLSRLIATRQAVRMPLMRATVHLVSARDALDVRPVVQSVLEQDLDGGPFGRRLADLDREDLLAAGRALLEERPRTRSELGRQLKALWPERDATALAYAITYVLPVVQVPPRGLWGSRGQAIWTTAEAWLGRPLGTDLAPDRLILRYLAAFGPATVRDIQTWSGLTRLQSALERLRPRLYTFRDEVGHELFDLPAAPRPDPNTLAPPRFLPEYDNVLLSHADRRRIITGNRRVPLPPGTGGAQGTVLVDGFFRAVWRIVRQGSGATLLVSPFDAPSAEERTALVEEGARLLAFAAADAPAHDVQIVTA